VKQGTRRHPTVFRNHGDEQRARAEEEGGVHRHVLYDFRRTCRLGFCPHLLEYRRRQLNRRRQAVAEGRQCLIGVQPDGGGEGTHVRAGIQPRRDFGEASFVERVDDSRAQPGGGRDGMLRDSALDPRVVKRVSHLTRLIVDARPRR
jgi:hypothetical protein